MSAKTSDDSDICSEIPIEKKGVINDEANSVCTECQDELNILGFVECEKNSNLLKISNNFDNIFLPTVEQPILEPLTEATKSLSQISLENESHEINFENVKNQSGDELRQIYFFNPNQRVEVENEVLVELLDNVETLHETEHLINNAKILYDKEVQTESHINGDNDPWDAEFPCETELQNIERSIRNASSSETHKKSENNSKFKNNETVTKRSKNNLKPNYNSMTAILLNRQKRLVHLANDIYQLSSYLDGIKKTLTTKEPLPINIPSPPAMTGYDSQFDFPNENRFGKLPIQIQPAKVINKPSGGTNGINTTKSSSRNGCGLTKLPAKRMSNGKNEPATKRFMCQMTSKDGSNANKENRSNEKHRKQSVNECSSMYEYNPLSSRTKTNTKQH